MSNKTTKPFLARFDLDTAARIESVAKASGTNASSVLRVATYLSLVLLEANPQAVNKIKGPVGRRFGRPASDQGVDEDYDETMDWLISLLASGLPRHIRNRLDKSTVDTGKTLMDALSSCLEIGSFFLALDDHRFTWAAATANGLLEDKYFKESVVALTHVAEEFSDRYEALWFAYRSWNRDPKTDRPIPTFNEGFRTYQELCLVMPGQAQMVDAMVIASKKPVLLPARISKDGSSFPRKVAEYLGRKYMDAMINGEALPLPDSKPEPKPKRAKKKPRK